MMVQYGAQDRRTENRKNVLCMNNIKIILQGFKLEIKQNFIFYSDES